MKSYYDHEMLEKIVQITKQSLQALDGIHDLRIALHYPGPSPEGNRSIVVDLELASLGAQIGFWSGGTGEIFAFDASKGDEGLIQYSCDIDHAEDVMPHLEIIIKLFREYHSK